MLTTDLSIVNNHLYISLEGYDWLLDTGSPKSFGNSSSLTIDGHTFSINKPSKHLSTFELSLYINHDTAGLLGTDILNNFNILFDLFHQKVTLSTRHIDLKGEHLPLSSHFGTPAISSTIDHKHYTMFFDTGAPLSYFQDSSLTSYPSVGTVEDFYPETGHFTTESYAVDMELGNELITLPCGTLPLELDTVVHALGADGIVGNSILTQREIGYFPLENELVIGAEEYDYEHHEDVAL